MTVQATKLFPVFAVRNVEEAMVYYRDRLGFTVAWTWGSPISRAGVALDGIEIQLDELEPGEAASSSMAYCHLQGVDAFYEACCVRGATVTMPIADRPWGMRDFRVVDPSGNRLGFASPLSR